MCFHIDWLHAVQMDEISIEEPCSERIIMNGEREKVLAWCISRIYGNFPFFLCN